MQHLYVNGLHSMPMSPHLFQSKVRFTPTRSALVDLVLLI